MKYTKGPWRIVEEISNQFGEVISRYITVNQKIGNADVPVHLCFNSVSVRTLEAEERRGNALLCAAAPDLYESLKYAIELLSRIDSNGDGREEQIESAIEEFEKAINKAEGR